MSGLLVAAWAWAALRVQCGPRIGGSPLLGFLLTSCALRESEKQIIAAVKRHFVSKNFLHDVVRVRAVLAESLTFVNTQRGGEARVRSARYQAPPVPLY